MLSLLYSCSDDADYYSTGNFRISLGLIDTENTYGYNYMIRCDNGDSLLPVSSSFYGYEPENNQRVLVNYTLLDEANESEKLFYVRVNNINDVLYKNVIEGNEANSDSLGNDPVIIDDIWLTGDILNIEFRIWGNVRTHYINLLYETNEQGAIDEPAELTFRHNRNNDDEKYLLNGLVSFNLTKLQNKESDSIRIRVNSTDYENNTHTSSGTYIYNEDIAADELKRDLQSIDYSFLSE
jgi:hypothetical protein